MIPWTLMTATYAFVPTFEKPTREKIGANTGFCPTHVAWHNLCVRFTRKRYGDVVEPAARTGEMIAEFCMSIG